MQGVILPGSSAQGFRAAMSVTYEDVLDVSEDGVSFLSGLVHGERVRRGTAKDTRALGTYEQTLPGDRGRSRTKGDALGVSWNTANPAVLDEGRRVQTPTTPSILKGRFRGRRAQR